MKDIYTFEDLIAEKNRVCNEIKEQKSKIQYKTQQLFSPSPKSKTKMGAMFGGFEKALAIYDGVMTGMRIVYRIRHLIRKR